jgi:hypothetical protein
MTSEFTMSVSSLGSTSISGSQTSATTSSKSSPEAKSGAQKRHFVPVHLTVSVRLVLAVNVL